jgi:hypothetical protein
MTNTAKHIRRGDPDTKSEAYPPGAELNLPLTLTLTGANGMKGSQCMWFHTGDCDISDPKTGEELGKIMPCLGGITCIHDTSRGETWSIGPDALWYLYQHYRAQLDEAYVERMKRDDSVRKKWHNRVDRKRSKKQKAAKTKVAEDRAKGDRQREKELAREPAVKAPEAIPEPVDEPKPYPRGATPSALHPALHALEEANRAAAAELGIHLGPGDNPGNLLDRYLSDPDGTMANMTKEVNQSISGDPDLLYTVDYNGWLSPGGEFAPCLYGNHISAAHKLASDEARNAHNGNAEHALEQTGWAKVTKGEWEWVQRPTEAQRNYILSWYMDRKLKIDEEMPDDKRVDLED